MKCELDSSLYNKTLRQFIERTGSPESFQRRCLLTALASLPEATSVYISKGLDVFLANISKVMPRPVLDGGHQANLPAKNTDAVLTEQISPLKKLLQSSKPLMHTTRAPFEELCTKLLKINISFESIKSALESLEQELKYPDVKMWRLIPFADVVQRFAKYLTVSANMSHDKAAEAQPFF